MDFLHSDFENIKCYSKNFYSEICQTPITNCIDPGIESNKPDLKDTEGRKGCIPRGLKSQMDDFMPVNWFFVVFQK